MTHYKPHKPTHIQLRKCSSLKAIINNNLEYDLFARGKYDVIPGNKKRKSTSHENIVPIRKLEEE